MGTQQGKFVGSYVSQMTEVLTASALSGVHALLIGAPGRGKTAVARVVAKRVFGDEYVFMRLDATTPPEKVRGHADVAKLLGDDPTYEMVVDGTALDPAAKMVLADEIGRPMDMIFDIFLDVMDRQDVEKSDAPVLWGTTNFMPTSERTDAFRDRFGLWFHVPVERLDVVAIVKSQLTGYSGGMDVETVKFPNIQQVYDARHAQPGDKAITAIANKLEALAEAAIAGVGSNGTVKSFDPHPRRLEQWGRVLFGYSHWLLGGDDNFSTVPDQATNLLRFAWPLLTPEDAHDWGEVCQSIVDPVGLVIQDMLDDAYQEFKKCKDSGGARADVALKLGEAMADSMRKIRDFAAETGAEDDPRIADAIKDVQSVYSKIVVGQDPFGV